MEKINRLPLSEIPELQKLMDNWKVWGQEYKEYIDGGKKKSTGVGWSWRKGIYTELRSQLEALTQGHCSFCDGYPIGNNSKETIEHYQPKELYPEIAYQWGNLFYCCDKCQSEANKTLFKYTLKPDLINYEFNKCLYFNLGDGTLNVLESLEKTAPKEFKKAKEFLERYGINHPKRNKARQHLFHDVKNFLQNQLNNPKDNRKRDDFPYRYVFDFVEIFLIEQKM